MNILLQSTALVSPYHQIYSLVFPFQRAVMQQKLRLGWSGNAKMSSFGFIFAGYKKKLAFGASIDLYGGPVEGYVLALWKGNTEGIRKGI